MVSNGEILRLINKRMKKKGIITISKEEMIDVIVKAEKRKLLTTIVAVSSVVIGIIVILCMT